MKTPLSLVLRVLALAGVVFAVLHLAGVVAEALFPPPDPRFAHSLTASPNATLAWVAISLLYAMVLAYPVVRSRWTGWRLALASFTAFYGIATFLVWIEVAVFMPHVVSMGMILWVLAVDGIAAAIIAPLTVVLFGKWRRGATEEAENRRLVMSRGRWTWKLAVVVVTYVFLYIVFGALVAWRNPAVQDFYSGAEMPSAATILSLQLFRALIWAAVALPVIRMMKGPWWETSLAVGLQFAVLMNAGLLAPNPLMPEAVRMTHLVETASSNFIFGWFMVWLLLRVKAKESAVTHGGPGPDPVMA
jgi:hypothetical protein